MREDLRDFKKGDVAFSFYEFIFNSSIFYSSLVIIFSIYHFFPLPFGTFLKVFFWGTFYHPLDCPKGGHPSCFYFSFGPWRHIEKIMGFPNTFWCVWCVGDSSYRG
jgi:hypothetical protein